MFRELMPLLNERTIMITLARIDDSTVRVCVIPKRIKEGNQSNTEENALCAPLAVTGTLDELDREFARQLTRYVGATVRLGSNFAEIEAAHEAATKAFKEEKKKDLDRQRGKSSGTKNAASVSTVSTGSLIKNGKPVFGTKDGQLPNETETVFDRPPAREVAEEASSDNGAASECELPITQSVSVQEQTEFNYPD